MEKNFLFTHSKKNPIIWIGFVGSILILITCLIVLLAIWFSQSHNQNVTLLWILIIVTLIVVLEVKRKTRLFARKTFDDFIKEEAQIYIVIDSGFSKKDSHENNFLKWTDFQEAFITKNIILLLDDIQIISFLSKNYTLDDF